MIAVATIQDEVARVWARLLQLGLTPTQVVAPGESRRVVLASTVDDRSATPVAMSLRDEGEMAVTRPDGGAALRAWFRDTRPVTIGDRLSVCLAWSEHDRADLPAVIELGTGGFGSGHHPTTVLIIEEMIRRVGGGERVLDVGCGSGILGLCALGLGAREVVATDLKAEAVDATRHNAELNGMGARVVATLVPPVDLARTFEVVVANIARAGIVELAPDLVARVAADGWLAVSGITPSQCDQVAGFLRPLVEIERWTAGDWSVLVLGRP